MTMLNADVCASDVYHVILALITQSTAEADGGDAPELIVTVVTRGCCHINRLKAKG